MNKLYYLDTSIWLDFFENRDEPNLPKSMYAKKLIQKIAGENNKIIVSEVIKNEFVVLGYLMYEINNLFIPLKNIIINIYSTKKQFNKSKDLSKKRKVPLFDALHALIARDNKATMITRDRHFDKIKDIINYKKPEDII